MANVVDISFLLSVSRQVLYIILLFPLAQTQNAVGKTLLVANVTLAQLANWWRRELQQNAVSQFLNQSVLVFI